MQSLQAGNSDYDVMALDVIWTADFAANQWLAPLEGDLEVDTSGLLQSTVDSATYNGTLYALPQNTNGQLLFRNTEIIPEAPANWADLVESCTLAEEAGVDCLTTQLKQYEGLSVNTIGFIEGWGGSVLDDDGNVTVDSDDAKAGLQALVDGFDDGTISKASLAATEEETNLAFTEGQTAYAINWPYMYTNSEEAEATAGKFEVQPLVGKDGVGVSTLVATTTASTSTPKTRQPPATSSNSSSTKRTKPGSRTTPSHQFWHPSTMMSPLLSSTHTCQH